MDLQNNDASTEHNRDFLLKYLSHAKQLDPDFNTKEFMQRHIIYIPLKDLHLASVLDRRPDMVVAMLKNFERNFHHRHGKNFSGCLRWIQKFFGKDASEAVGEEVDISS